MQLLRGSLFVMMAIMLTISTYGQDPYYTTINKSNGLPSNSVYDIFQDSKGFVWVTGDEGLCRYDGFEFKRYSNPMQTSLGGNKIAEDKYGRIWYKNFDGCLYYVEHDSLKTLTQHATIGNTEFGLIGNTLIVLQKNGLDFFELRTLKLRKTIPFDYSTIVSELQYKDTFYISASPYVYKISANGVADSVQVRLMGMMAGSKNGIITVNRDNPDGYCHELEGRRELQKIYMPEIKYIHGVSYCDGMYWFFSPNGVWVYGEEGTNINGHQAFFADRSISSVMKDRDGNYWMGTLNQGIVLVPDMRTKLIAQAECTPKILAQTKGKLYVGTQENSICVMDTESGKLETKFREDVRHEVTCLLPDTVSNRIYISSTEFIITDDELHNITRYSYAVKDVVPIDKKYIAFAATGLAGLIKLRDDISSPWDGVYAANKIAGMPGMCNLVTAGRAKTIAYMPETKAIYVGSNNGLQCITRAGIASVTINKQPLYVRKLINYKGKIYALTTQSGIYAINRLNEVYQVLAGNEHEQFQKLRSTDGRLLLVTGTNIRMLDTVTGTFGCYSENPGIRSDEINDLEIVNGRLVIASDRGLIVTDRKSSQRSAAAPKFVINKLLINGNQVNEEHLNKLAYSENDIDIRFSILSFNPSKHYELYYKINDSKWQQVASTTRSLKLASMSPGKYTISFQLRSDSNEVFGQPTVNFTINNPFWAEWWFWCAGLVMVSVGGYAYYKWQTRLLNKKNALVLEKVELEKNLRNSMLTSIRAQMNPHFFYNALNTIQSFIFSDDKRNASTYLVKLSRLTRMILEMSEQEAIPLDEETEALKLYLELEKMRFDNDFTFDLKIADDVDSELVRIPSMIVQPYVENAIKHGLLHKKGSKHLSIHFMKADGNLCITIDDNGIGRVKANELQQIKKEKHLPFATYANSRRIELLNKERSKNIGIIYTDKTNEEGMAAGTRVTISIPLI